MKIAINCMYCTPQGGGIKEYIVNLVQHLSSVDHENEYLLYVFKDQYDYAKMMFPRHFRIKSLPYRSTFFSKIYSFMFSQAYWYNEEEKEGFNVFHSPHFHSPKFKKAKLVLTVHDLRLYRFPWTYSFIRLLYLYFSVKASIKRSDAIISVSQFTKNEIVECCKVSPDKITVIHEAVDKNVFSESCFTNDSLPEKFGYLSKNRFLFSLGHIERRKNYSRLLEAFEALKCYDKNKDLKLVIAGRLNMKSKRILKKIENADDVIYLSFIPRDFLLWLYKNAALFVFPSYYEGFGFPPLEAGCLGTISAVSNVSSMPEICGDAVAYFNPFDVDDMAATISRCLNDELLRANLKCKMRDNLGKYSWTIGAENTIAVYNRFQQK